MAKFKVGDKVKAARGGVDSGVIMKVFPSGRFNSLGQAYRVKWDHNVEENQYEDDLVAANAALNAVSPALQKWLKSEAGLIASVKKERNFDWMISKLKASPDTLGIKDEAIRYFEGMKLGTVTNAYRFDVGDRIVTKSGTHGTVETKLDGNFYAVKFDGRETSKVHESVMRAENAVCSSTNPVVNRAIAMNAAPKRVKVTKAERLNPSSLVGKTLDVIGGRGDGIFVKDPAYSSGMILLKPGEYEVVNAVAKNASFRVGQRVSFDNGTPRNKGRTGVVAKRNGNSYMIDWDNGDSTEENADCLVKNASFRVGQKVKAFDDPGIIYTVVSPFLEGGHAILCKGPNGEEKRFLSHQITTANAVAKNAIAATDERGNVVRIGDRVEERGTHGEHIGTVYKFGMSVAGDSMVFVKHPKGDGWNWCAETKCVLKNTLPVSTNAVVRNAVARNATVSLDELLRKNGISKDEFTKMQKEMARTGAKGIHYLRGKDGTLKFKADGLSRNAKFKPGARVKVYGTAVEGIEGMTGTVKRCGPRSYLIDWDNGNPARIVDIKDEKHLKAINSTAVNAKYKVSQRVTAAGRVGKIGEVLGKDANGEQLYAFIPESGVARGRAVETIESKISTNTVRNAKFKVGDKVVIRAQPSHGVCEIVGVYGEGMSTYYAVRTRSGAMQKEYDGNLERA